MQKLAEIYEIEKTIYEYRRTKYLGAVSLFLINQFMPIGDVRFILQNNNIFENKDFLLGNLPIYMYVHILTIVFLSIYLVQTILIGGVILIFQEETPATETLNKEINKILLILGMIFTINILSMTIGVIGLYIAIDLFVINFVSWTFGFIYLFLVMLFILLIVVLVIWCYLN